jgi:hypothetical protein
MKSTYWSAGMSVEAVATRADKKILPEVKRGVEIFFRLLVLPLWVCFCEQSGGMTKTALPIRFKPAWAGLSNKLPLKLKIPQIPILGIWGKLRI